MIRLLFVGDGERDAVTNPPLVETIIGTKVEPEAIPWPRLNKAGKGFDRKLLFALQNARDKNLDGVVATVDQDKSRDKERLRSLEAARAKDREAAVPMPAALGCAYPHAEAWLLDDAVAVREAMRLERDTPIPTVRKVKSPKDEIAVLHANSPRSSDPIRTILVEIARRLDPDRCQHAHETGFAHFTKEVESEIAPLVRSS